MDTQISPDAILREEVFMSEKRRQFTREFKLEAVRLAASGEKSVAQAARELGIRDWKRQVESRPGLAATDVFPGNGQVPRWSKASRGKFKVYFSQQSG
jgi:transposase-like protein